MLSIDNGLLRVLRQFTDTDTVGFTELAAKLQFDTDLTGYYLRKLQHRDMIEKIKRGTYRITPLGKSVLAHGNQLSHTAFAPRTSVMIVASHQDCYIVIERSHQPFMGRVEWPTAPLNLGISMEEAARETVHLRFGLTETQPRLYGLFRRIDLYEGTVLDDKLFAIHVLELNTEQLAQLTHESGVGSLHTMSEADLETLSKPSRSLLDVLVFIRSNIAYAEHLYLLTTADFYGQSPSTVDYAADDK